MEDAKQQFPIDYENNLFEIRIVVKKNCNEFQIINIKEGYEVSYQSAIGALETTKCFYVMEQGFFIRMEKLKKKEDDAKKRIEELESKIPE